MNALALNNNSLLTADSFSVSMVHDFITYIDRGEKTTQTYLTNLKQFVAWLRYSSIKQPTRADIICYREYLAAEHEAIKLDNENMNGWSYRTDANGNKIITSCKANTVAQYLRSVCQFFKWTASEGIYPNIAENIHAPKIRTDAHKKEALRADNVQTIYNSIVERSQAQIEISINSAKDSKGKTERATEQGKRLKAMYMLAVSAGLRTIELERANVKDLELINGQAYLYIWGKGHSEADQKKALAPAVYDAIKEYLSFRSDRLTSTSPLFVSTGNRSKGKRIAARTISTMLKQAMKEAGFDSDRITAHSLRHTAGTMAIELTNNLQVAQRYMRHANPATTQIYLHNDTDKQEAQLAMDISRAFFAE